MHELLLESEKREAKILMVHEVQHYLFHGLAALDGATLHLEGKVEDESDNPGLLLQLGDDA